MSVFFYGHNNMDISKVYRNPNQPRPLNVLWHVSSWLLFLLLPLVLSSYLCLCFENRWTSEKPELKTGIRELTPSGLELKTPSSESKIHAPELKTNSRIENSCLSIEHMKPRLENTSPTRTRTHTHTHTPTENAPPRLENVTLRYEYA